MEQWPNLASLLSSPPATPAPLKPHCHTPPTPGGDWCSFTSLTLLHPHRALRKAPPSRNPTPTLSP